MPLSRVRNSGCLDGHLHLSTARQVTGTLPTDITQPFNSGSGRVGFGQRPGCTTATLKKLPQHHRDDECIFGVGSGGSGDEKAAVQGHKRLKGGLPSRCRPTLPALATTAVTEQQNWIYTPAPLRLTLPPLLSRIHRIDLIHKGATRRKSETACRTSSVAKVVGVGRSCKLVVMRD